MLLSPNLIWFPFKYLMITEIFIRTLWGRGGATAFFSAKGSASIAFTGNTFPSKAAPSPTRMFSVGQLPVGLPFRAKEEGGASKSPEHKFS